MNRYPRPEMVLIKRGLVTSSPSASRSFCSHDVQAFVDLDKGVAPQPVPQLLLCNHFPRAFEQDEQHLKRQFLNIEGLPSVVKDSSADPYFKRVEAIGIAGCGRGVRSCHRNYYSALPYGNALSVLPEKAMRPKLRSTINYSFRVS
jgi:hypothetical protein